MFIRVHRDLYCFEMHVYSQEKYAREDPADSENAGFTTENARDKRDALCNKNQEFDAKEKTQENNPTNVSSEI